MGWLPGAGALLYGRPTRMDSHPLAAGPAGIGLVPTIVRGEIGPVDPCSPGLDRSCAARPVRVGKPGW